MNPVESVKDALHILVTYWWAYLPVLLFWLLVDIWGDHNRAKYLSSLDWVVLRIKFPHEVAASFKAMEQVFANIHGAYPKDLDWDEKFFEGKSIDWFSFEITGSNGEVGFYIRTLKDHRNLVESSIYAQYPEAEVSETADYTQFLEGEVPSDEYDIFGMEVIFTEKNYFPIRTYEYFEDVSGGPRVPRVDPLASLSELLGSLKIGEHIWIQYNLEPTGDYWTKDGDKKVEELTKGGEEPSGDEAPVFKSISQKDREVAKGIINKTSKIGFNTTIRWVYIAKKDIFSKSMSAAISGTFKQFSAQGLNGFKPDKTTLPKAKWSGFMGKWPLKLIPYPWADSKVHFKKKKLFKNYLERAMSGSNNQIILNTEEIATMYHLPSIEVKAPLLGRIEARKGTPPPSLPTKENE